MEEYSRMSLTKKPLEFFIKSCKSSNILISLSLNHSESWPFILLFVDIFSANNR